MSSNSFGYLGTSDFTFFWEIYKFSTLVNENSIIWSRRYYIDGMEWILCLETNKEDKDFLSIFLKNTSCKTTDGGNKEINVSYEISLLNKHWRKTNKRNGICTFSKKTFCWGFRKFISRTFLNTNQDKYLFKDKMIISCRIHINSYQNNVLEQETELSDAYELLFENSTMSDLAIRIGRKKLRAHKSILSARSKVFAAMFQHDMAENNLNEIKITDISYEVMIEVLRFIYSGKVNNIEELAKPLIIAADKYDLSTLKSTCEEVIWKTISSENACEFLKLADTYNCTKLKAEIINFVVKNMKEMVDTAGFTELTDSKSSLVGEILREVAKQKYS